MTRKLKTFKTQSGNWLQQLDYRIAYLQKEGRSETVAKLVEYRDHSPGPDIRTMRSQLL